MNSSEDEVEMARRWRRRSLTGAWISVVSAGASIACEVFFILAYSTKDRSVDPAPFTFAFTMGALIFAVLANEFFKAAKR